MYSKTYSKMMEFKTFDERLDYLKLWDIPHVSPRSISESFYKSKRWLATRDEIIKRDLACDLGVFGIYIYTPIYVHHINPITEEDIVKDSWKLYDPENLISSSRQTHNSIHYKPKEDAYVERKPGDTKLW